MTKSTCHASMISSIFILALKALAATRYSACSDRVERKLASRILGACIGSRFAAHSLITRVRRNSSIRPQIGDVRIRCSANSFQRSNIRLVTAMRAHILLSRDKLAEYYLWTHETILHFLTSTDRKVSALISGTP